VDTFPHEKPDRIVAHFEPTLFPTHVDGVRLEVRLRVNGDLNCQYVEDRPGEQWECRWDRHENPHNTREHFHPPPTVGEESAVDCFLPSDLNETVGMVLAFVEQRIGDLWDRAAPVYPGEYEYRGEYGPESGHR
jgi:hypothetical protein